MIQTLSAFCLKRTSQLQKFVSPCAQFDSSVLNSAIDAWSVSGKTLSSSDLASSFFAGSLIPYLTMLYFLSRPNTNTPKGAFNGFAFLLVFVFATIPAGIYAKYRYGDILANVDWLHGSAESLLTVTNILIIFGFRGPRESLQLSSDTKTTLPANNEALLQVAFSLLAGVVLLSQWTGVAHAEPVNALSLPTWVVHTSSVLEWLIAMRLVWDHATVSGNTRWRGLAVAMIPSHASGLCACVFHSFYNSPALSGLVLLQALLTLVGNTCMATAAYRIFQSGSEYQSGSSSSELLLAGDNAPIDLTVETGTLESPPSSSRLQKTSTVGLTPLESTPNFALQLLVKAVVAGVAVKYGELYLRTPFAVGDSGAAYTAAAVAVVLPVALNACLYVSRSLQLAESRRAGPENGLF